MYVQWVIGQDIGLGGGGGGTNLFRGRPVLAGEQPTSPYLLNTLFGERTVNAVNSLPTSLPPNHHFGEHTFWCNYCKSGEQRIYMVYTQPTLERLLKW